MPRSWEAEGTLWCPLLNQISNNSAGMPYPPALLALLCPLSFARTLGGRNGFAHFLNEDMEAVQLAEGDRIQTRLCPLVPTL